jgi:DEAD/DEAH box helicase domain-containing protein
MPKDIVYFDLETQRTANDVGGWNHKDKMGMSVGVTYSTKLGKYTIYAEPDVDALIEQLVRADLVVGYNTINFDYQVLQGYTAWDIGSQAVSLDLMVELEKMLGHRLKLEAVATATLGVGKTGDGLDAIRWWQEGKVMQIAEYCCYDVKATKEVHEFGVRHGHVKYGDRFGRIQVVQVDWAGSAG